MDYPLLQLAHHPSHQSLEATSDSLCQPQTRPNNDQRLQRIACYALHTVLAAAHIALLVIVSGFRGQAISISLEESIKWRFPLLVTIVLQCVGTAYLAVLLFMTQRLALSRDFRTRQTLSAIHDKSSAWLGLGSSIGSLVHQFKIPAAVHGVVQITLYLLCAFTLHITIPSVASIVTHTVVESTIVPTQLAYGSNFALSSFSYDILPVYDQFETPGLRNATIYDIIPLDKAAVGSTEVNSTAFVVICASLPDAVQARFDGQSQGNTSALYTFQLTPTSSASVKVPMHKSFSITSATSHNDTAHPSHHTIFVSSTIPVLDVVGNRGPVTPIQPAVDLPSNGQSQDKIAAVQLMACDITLVNQTVSIDSETGQPSPNTSAQAVAVWTKWTEPNPPSDPLLFRLDAFGQLSLPSSHWPWFGEDNLAASAQIADGKITNSEIVPSTLDVFIMNDLGMFSRGRDNVTLEEIESSLAKAATAVTWYELNRNSTSKYGGQPRSIPAPDRQGEATIYLSEIRNKLSLNSIPIHIGLAASCLLLALAISLTKPVPGDGYNPHPIVKTGGVLELLWILGNEPQISQVPSPRLDNLRAAGMFEVNMSERARQRMKQPDVDAETYSFIP